MKALTSFVFVAAAVSGLAVAAPESTAPAAAPAASQSATPGGATGRALGQGLPVDTVRNEGSALPQIAVPLRRGERDPVALKPGRPAPKTGGVDDSAARCRAEKDPAKRADCLGPVEH